MIEVADIEQVSDVQLANDWARVMLVCVTEDSQC